ncbi:MAG: parvulin-like peptidyl-prolyl isomerase [Paracoccaceae bacterium]|jgi:parvulin-like peptidyl-prolyl isomerase
MTALRHAAFIALTVAALSQAAPAAAQTAAPGAASGAAFAPAAFVNDQVISAYDIAQRGRLNAFLQAADGPEAALEGMIEERLKRGAAKDAGIAVERPAVEAALTRFAQGRGVDAAGLQAQLAAAGVSRVTLRDFIETEIVWSAYVRRTFLTRAQVSDLELQDEIETSDRIVQVTYDLSEISMPYRDDPATVRALAARISAEVNGGGDAAALARRHSRSETASKGGRIGAVPSERMPPAIKAAVDPLRPGQATAPIEVPGGIVVLVLNDRIETRPELNAEGREQVRTRMLEERLTRLADGRLAELRARAFIDRRR